MKLFQNWTRGLGQWTDDGWTKTDHKSSLCHYVTDELKRDVLNINCLQFIENIIFRSLFTKNFLLIF